MYIVFTNKCKIYLVFGSERVILYVFLVLSVVMILVEADEDLCLHNSCTTGLNILNLYV